MARATQPPKKTVTRVKKKNPQMVTLKINLLLMKRISMVILNPPLYTSRLWQKNAILFKIKKNQVLTTLRVNTLKSFTTQP